MSQFKKVMMAISLALLLVTAIQPPAMANERGTESGDDVAIIFDLVILRPVGLVATVGGTAIFICSLPISLPTLSVGKAFRALVVNPAHYTFVRTLGDEI
jgi:hypothetical protein